MKFIGRLIDLLAAVPLVVLLVIFNIAVVMRYWFNQPLQWTEEMSGLLMIWIVMLGSISAERTDQHLSIPIVVELLPAKVGAIVNFIVASLSAAFLLYVSYVGYQLAMSVQYKVTDVLRISYFWIDIAVPVSFILVAFYMVQRGYNNLRATMQGDPA